jgi:cyclophilin family peptidyl-prolyl cis-trans isomerase
MARHPEMAEVARPILAEALAAPESGVVAKAASAVRAHPMRELDGPVAAALRVALAHPWSRDRIETRAGIIEAALALGLPEARRAAETACRDDNPTLRGRVAKAVSTAGVSGVRCAPPEERGQPAPEIGHELSTPVRVVLDTDAGPLVLRLDPVAAPVAVSRVVALALAGFYSGISFHRVLPGYLAQFGDPGGDGFGGSGDWLRCETSPIPFERGDIGVALAGRDTGSSQLFVTLARTPSLDGEYAWLGHAEGDWDAVVEGDVIRSVRVEPP